MVILELEWDDENVEHIAEHGVNPEEVEDICFGLHLVEKEGNNRYVLSGQSRGGRYLNVIIEKVGKGRFRPVTAFDMSENYKARYRKKKIK